MTYTAKSREELIEQVKEYLKSEELQVKTEDENKGGYSLMYILIRKYSPEKTTAVASNESGGVFMFYPYDEKEDFSEPWDFDADRLLFEMLGEGYEILDMTMDGHLDVWFYVSEMGMDGIWYKQGMQKYLEYCVKNGVTGEVLQREMEYDGDDLLALYCPEGREDLFMRVENFKNEPWYGDLVLYSRIGVCKTKPECAPEVCKSLKQLGYSVRLKAKDGELYVLPAKDKKPKDMEAR